MTSYGHTISNYAILSWRFYFKYLNINTDFQIMRSWYIMKLYDQLHADDSEIHDLSIKIIIQIFENLKKCRLCVFCVFVMHVVCMCVSVSVLYVLISFVPGVIHTFPICVMKSYDQLWPYDFKLCDSVMEILFQIFEYRHGFSKYEVLVYHEII